MSRAHNHIAIIANDNDPISQRPRGDAAGFNAALRETQARRAKREHDLYAPLDLENKNAVPAKGDFLSKLGFVCLFASLCAVMFALLTPQAAMTRVIALSALTWTGLWMRYLCADTEQPRLASLATLLASLGGLGLWVVAATQLGLPISAADGAAGFAAVTLIAAFILRSPMTLIMSCCAALMWLVSFVQLDAINRTPLMVLPLLTLCQIFFAAHYKSAISGLTATITSYLWLGLMAFQFHATGDVNILQIAGGIALIGFAHYRFGKTAGDKGVHHASLHVTLGWVAAVLGGLALQHYWLGLDASLWDDMAPRPAGTFIWTLAAYGTLGLIITGTVLRWIGGRASAIGVMAVMAVAGGLYYSTANPDTIGALVLSQTGFSAIPALGLVIAGIISASALAMCINGVRRRITVMIGAGLVAIMAQAALLSRPDLWTQDNIIIFSLSSIIALCMAALLASESMGSSTNTSPYLGPKNGARGAVNG